jgi:hypothetical protein
MRFSDNNTIKMEQVREEEWKRCGVISSMGVHLAQLVTFFPCSGTRFRYSAWTHGRAHPLMSSHANTCFTLLYTFIPGSYETLHRARCLEPPARKPPDHTHNYTSPRTPPRRLEKTSIAPASERGERRNQHRPVTVKVQAYTAAAPLRSGAKHHLPRHVICTPRHRRGEPCVDKVPMTPPPPSSAVPLVSKKGEMKPKRKNKDRTYPRKTKRDSHKIPP